MLCILPTCCECTAISFFFSHPMRQGVLSLFTDCAGPKSGKTDSSTRPHAVRSEDHQSCLRCLVASSCPSLPLYFVFGSLLRSWTDRRLMYGVFPGSLTNSSAETTSSMIRSCPLLHTILETCHCKSPFPRLLFFPGSQSATLHSTERLLLRLNHQVWHPISSASHTSCT